MSIKHTKIDEKINNLNLLIDFVEENIVNPIQKDRFRRVLRHQKALVRDIDRKGRKVPVNTPYVCEITGIEVNSIREKEPPFKLEQNLHLGYQNGIKTKLIEDILHGEIEHNTYSHILNNYSLKAMKKLLGRKIVFKDLSNVEDNLVLIMEVFKHKNYYKKYINIETFEEKIDDIQKSVDKM